MRYPSLSTYAIALLGGCMFQLLHIPIPFILGPRRPLCLLNPFSIWKAVRFH